MSKVIKLDETITLPSGKKISEITITDAINQCGCLRGLKIFEVVSGDVNALTTLLPRITSPRLEAFEINQLPPSVLFKLSIEVANFLGGNSAEDEAESPETETLTA